VKKKMSPCLSVSYSLQCLFWEHASYVRETAKQTPNM